LALTTHGYLDPWVEQRPVENTEVAIPMEWFTIVVAVVAVVLVVTWFAFARRHPESASGHEEDRPHVDAAGRGTGSSVVTDRPAGPDAENMRGEPPGGFTPPGSTGTSGRGEDTSA
jgi:hypothetical protein